MVLRRFSNWSMALCIFIVKPKRRENQTMMRNSEKKSGARTVFVTNLVEAFKKAVLEEGVHLEGDGLAVRANHLRERAKVNGW